MPGAEPAAHRQALARLIDGAAAFGLTLSPDSIDCFRMYLDTLLLWRTRLSLTAARTARDLVEHHFIDSLSVVRFVEPGFSVADIGSGAGLPGIPIAIVCPRATVTLIEARRKRANFLREVARTAHLPNVVVCEQRAESLAAPQAAFDVVVSRALGPLADFLELSAQLLRPGGLAIAMKGPKGLTELNPSPSFSPPDVVTYALSGGRTRLLVVFRHL